MGFRRDLMGRCHFFDDESVELDCGCYADAGDDYVIDVFEVCDKKDPVIPENMKHIAYSHCDKEECICQMYEHLFDKYMHISFTDSDTRHLKTDQDEIEDYADYMADREDD